MSDPSPTAGRSRALRALLWALLGLLYGGTVALALHRDHLDRPPEGWSLHRPDLPVQLSSLTQAIRAPGWPLDSHNLLRTDAVGVQSLAVAGTLPHGARLSVQLTDGHHTVGLELSQDGTPHARQQLQRDGRTSPMRCQGGALPPPREAFEAEVAVESGAALITHGGQTLRCNLPPLGPLRGQVEAGLAQVRLERLETALPSGPQVQMAQDLSWLRVGGLAALGALVLGVVGALLPRVGLIAALGLGLAPVLSATGIETLLEALRLVAPRPQLWVATVPAALAAWLGLCVAAVLGLRQERTPPLWAVAAAGGALGLFGLPAYGALGGVFGVVGTAALALVLVAAGRRVWPREAASIGRLVLAMAVLGGALGLAVLALRPRYGMAGAVAAEVGGLAAVVLWANVRAVRGFNLISLVSALLIVVLSNHGLRWTAWGDRLVGRSARAVAAGEEDDRTSAFSSFEALETTRQWTDYPDQDYPVAPPARRPGALRIVAMGGSSTGGAWQNDDLDEFWPAELERRLGARVQVVNLGVGGWTSFHVRRFLQTRLDAADPDIVVLYIAHNDAMTPSPLPYAQLFEAWRQRTDWRIGISERLGQQPLYQVLRFSLVAGVLDQQGVAVPPEDFAENVDLILGLLRQRDARLVLAMEGVTPAHPELAHWKGIMQDRAQAEDVLFVDTAEQLRAATGAPVFLDACHLTQRGHGVVAGALEAALKDAGWVR
jgi:lysophospholipase L1-like esterase